MIKKIILIQSLLLLVFIFSCSRENQKTTLNNWPDLRATYNWLDKSSSDLHSQTGIKFFYQDGIRTASGKQFKIDELKDYTPTQTKKIIEVTTKLKEINSGITIGNDYVSFVLSSGGVLESDSFLVSTKNESSLDNFKADFNNLGYSYLSHRMIDKNWYLVMMD